MPKEFSGRKLKKGGNWCNFEERIYGGCLPGCGGAEDIE